MSTSTFLERLSVEPDVAEHAFGILQGEAFPQVVVWSDIFTNEDGTETKERSNLTDWTITASVSFYRSTIVNGRITEMTADPATTHADLPVTKSAQSGGTVGEMYFPVPADLYTGSIELNESEDVPTALVRLTGDHGTTPTEIDIIRIAYVIRAAN